MNVYSIDVKIYATAYIRAETQEQALEIARELKDTALNFPDYVDSDPMISGRQYDDPDLPDLSLSPIMTIHGPDAEDTPNFVEELIP
jgi:hypothetical protein